ncbi:MAG: hypothetical protein AB7K09_13640 [Planctomycetota bacterium]
MDPASVAFNAVCDDCVSYIHACKGCKFFNPRVSQSCEIPQADYVGDKDGRNLCEFFRAHEGGPRDPKETAKVKSKEATQKFNDLFKTT